MKMPLSPEPTRYWDKIAKRQSREPSTILWRRYSDAINERIIAEWAPLRARHALKTDLFDEAVHTGIYPQVRTRADHFSGVDLSAEVAAQAFRRYPSIQATVSDVRSLPFCDDRFDFILSTSTLDHFREMQDLELSLMELNRVLCPSGTLIITMDNLANPILFLRNIISRFARKNTKFRPYFMGKTFHPWNLKAHLSRTGFILTEQATVMHFPRILLVAFAKLLLRHFKIQQILDFCRRFEVLQKTPWRASLDIISRQRPTRADPGWKAMPWAIQTG